MRQYYASWQKALSYEPQGLLAIHNRRHQINKPGKAQTTLGKAR